MIEKYNKVNENLLKKTDVILYFLLIWYILVNI